MNKNKNTNPQDISAKLDRLPSREQTIEGLKKVFGPIADFYGFEKIQPSLVYGNRAFSALVKNGFLDERSPVVLKNKNGEAVILRPSGVLGVLQAYAAHRMSDLPHPLKFTIEAEGFFNSRKESSLTIRPELGLMIIGENSPIADAEVILIVWKSLEELKMKSEDVEIRINATGCQDCRGSYRSNLASFLRSKVSKLCKNCKKNIKVNPTEIFYCEEEKCKIVANSAPSILDFLCETCKKYLRELLEFLDEVGIPYTLDAKLFRSGSIYNNIVFEIRARLPEEEAGDSKTSRIILAEGGRVSKAGELILERKMDAVSISIFLDAVESYIFRSKLELPKPQKPKVFLTQLGELAKRKSLTLLKTLRKGGIGIRESLGKDAIKSQLKMAEHAGAEIALILGQKESLDRTVIVRDVDSSIQETVPQDKLIDFLKRKLER